MSKRWLWRLAALLGLVFIHELTGELLAWSDALGGAFSPGPYAFFGVALALLFVAVRLTLWLIVLPASVAALARWLVWRS